MRSNVQDVLELTPSQIDEVSGGDDNLLSATVTGAGVGGAIGSFAGPVGFGAGVLIGGALGALLYSF